MKAASLAEAIKQSTGRGAKLKKGRNSSFEVTVGDEVIFSKLETKRFPTAKEVISSLQDLED